MPARCGMCGRLLRDAVSVEAGLGPVCRRKLNPQQRVAALARTGAAAVAASQLALPIPVPTARAAH